MQDREFALIDEVTRRRTVAWIWTGVDLETDVPLDFLLGLLQIRLQPVQFFL